MLIVFCAISSASFSEKPMPGKPVKGAMVYQRCLACHDWQTDLVGPHHCGLIGRKAGSIPGFPYSDAMLASEITWSPETLDAFLRDPTHYVEGTTMTYSGIKDQKERWDLIAFIVAVSNSSDLCGTAPGRLR